MLNALRRWSSKRTLHSLSSTEDDRAGALVRLAKAGDRRAVGLIVDWLIQYPPITPRDMRTAASVLHRLGIRDALNRIEPFLENRVRRERAFEVLGYLGEPAGALLKPLVAKGDPWAMAAYEVALGPKAVPFFLHLARMSEFGGARCVLQQGSADEVDAMLLLLLEKQPLEQLQPLLAQYLRTLTESHRAIGTVFQTSDADTANSKSELSPLPEDAMVLLAAALANADEAVRRRAAQAIVAAPPEAAASVLVPMLRHRNVTVRKEVAWLLNALHWQPETREDELRFCIAASNFDSFVEAGAESVPQLLKVIEYSPVAIAHALGRIGDTRAVPALTGLLKSHEPDVQAAAASALGQMRVVASAPELIQTLRLLLYRIDHGTSPANAERVYITILAALQKCMPESPPESLREAALQVAAAGDRLFSDRLSNGAGADG